VALTDSDFGLLQTSVDAMVERLASLHLNLVVERDFGRLMAFLRSMNSLGLNPTFDPDYNDLSNAGFWLRIVDQDGTTVASHAQRMFTTHDFHELLTSGRVWFPDGVSFAPGQEPIQVRRTSMLIHGVVAHAGGLWVSPVYRKKGLSLFLPFLSRSLCLRNYGADFHTALVLSSMAGSRIPTADYGYPHVEWCLRGWFPPTRRHEEDVHICYMTQAETIDRFRRLPDHPSYPADAFAERLKQAVNA
jgi:hypothetical protein